MTSLDTLLNEPSHPHGRFVGFVVQSLIVISLLGYAVSTLPELDQDARVLLRRLEVAIVALFTLEYLLRLVASRPSYRYALSFYGIVDLLAILPFYLASGLDLRSLRIFRLFRLARLLKLTRYSTAAQRLGAAFMRVRYELVVFGIATLMLIYLASVGIYFFESQAQPDVFKSVFHSMWWAVATLTTVGYGDVYPITVGGRVFTFVILMLGLGIVAIPAGLVASAISDCQALPEDGADEREK